MRTLSVACVLAFALGSAAGIAFAADNNPYLQRARSEIDQLRYDQAADSLDQALKFGGSSPSEVLDVLRMSGEVAAALERREVAEQFFQRLLMLDPSARLAPGVSPKIAQP